MEFVIIAAVVLVLALCLGADIAIVPIMLMVFLIVLLLVIFGFFIYSAVRLAGTKSMKGKFVRIGRAEGKKFDTAFYKIGENEFPNVFPCEVVMRSNLKHSHIINSSKKSNFLLIYSNAQKQATKKRYPKIPLAIQMFNFSSILLDSYRLSLSNTLLNWDLGIAAGLSNGNAMEPTKLCLSLSLSYLNDIGNALRLISA